MAYQVRVATMTTALVVDDDRAILDLLEERSLSMGHDCRKALTQTEAEEILEHHVFDYILLDLGIPNRFRAERRRRIWHNSDVISKFHPKARR